MIKAEIYYKKAETLLKEKWGSIEYISDYYKKNYQSDPYFAYFNSEFEVKSSFGTERTDSLEHRFDSWKVSDRIKE